MSGKPLLEMGILAVDDNPANVRLLERILGSAGFVAVEGVTDPTKVVAKILGGEVDLLLLDLMMPEMDGFAVMAALAEVVPAGSYLPILVLTADSSSETKRRALGAGAHDFLTKPFDPVEVELRIRNLLHTRSLHLQLMSHAETLEQRVAERTSELEQARVEVLERLALAAEFRDDETGKHTQRVGRACGSLSRELGLSAQREGLIRRAAPLHDIGKIGVPDAILLKPGRLTPAEFEVMKTHTTIGGRILSGSTVPLLQMAEQIALSHHEKWDGTGYPQGLAGNQIPLPGRILAVVDVFDALTSPRPYKPAWTPADALAEIKAQSGRHFDPDAVEAFVHVLDSTGGSEWSEHW